MRHKAVRRLASRKWLPIAGMLAVGALVGAASLMAAMQAVHYSSTDEFCTNACHSMQWATDAYRRSEHYSNSLGLRAGCADCHVPYHTKHSGPLEYLERVAFKTKIGIRDMIAEARGEIATRGQWEQERPRLSREVEQWFKDSRSITCQQCHDLKAFGGDYSKMTKMVHADLLLATTVNCIKCHKRAGHVYGADPEAESQTDASAEPPPHR